jgi:hypothetical protein
MRFMLSWLVQIRKPTFSISLPVEFLACRLSVLQTKQCSLLRFGYFQQPDGLIFNKARAISGLSKVCLNNLLLLKPCPLILKSLLFGGCEICEDAVQCQVYDAIKRWKNSSHRQANFSQCG